MSWSVLINAKRKSDIDAAVDAAEPSFHVTESDHVRKTVAAQLKIAQAAAKSIAKQSGFAVMSVSLAGHVNPPDANPRIHSAAWPAISVVITEAAE